MPATKPNELKKRKLPKLFANSEGGWDGIGKYKCRDENGDLRVNWCAIGGEVRDASFADLCVNPDMAEQRRELGSIIAGVTHEASKQSLRSIPDINEAMRYSNMLDREVSLWKHWAVVPAGHMLFPEPRNISTKSPPKRR